MADAEVHTVQLGSDSDVAGFRAAVRRLISHEIEPDRVRWQISGAAELDLFASIPAPLATPVDESAHQNPPMPPLQPLQPLQSLRLPAELVALCERAALHRDPQRHALLYQWLWRLAHQPSLRTDPLDPGRLQVELLARDT